MAKKATHAPERRPGINDDIGEEVRLRMYRMQFELREAEQRELHAVHAQPHLLADIIVDAGAAFRRVRRFFRHSGTSDQRWNSAGCGPYQRLPPKFVNRARAGPVENYRLDASR